MSRIITLITLIVISLPQLSAQSLSDILSQISHHNPELRAVQHANQSLLAGMRSDNALGETSVEYTPFYQRGYDGVASSEMIVSQSFDFPTLYATRGRANSYRANALDMQYQMAVRDVMLRARQLCFDLCIAQSRHDLLRQRQLVADDLLRLLDMRMAQGDATRIELNRVKLERMSVSADLLRSQATIADLRTQLVQLNGGSPLPQLDSLRYEDVEAYALLHRLPNSVDNVLPESRDGGNALEVGIAENQLQSSVYDVKAARQGWLPQLTLGWRWNTDAGVSSHGVLVGMSLPLFANSSKVKAARLSRTAAEDNLSRVRVEQDARLSQLRNQASHQQAILDTYDPALMQETLTLLTRAVEGGQLTVTDAMVEIDKIYQLFDARLAAQQLYCTTLTELFREEDRW